MIFVVAPERVPWVASVPRCIDPGRPVRVFAPWSTPALGTAWAGLKLGLRVRARGRVERVMAHRFALRRVLDALAARAIPKEARAVVAPSLGARRVFAAAHERGIATYLVEDLPDFRGLHRDLDAAAERHPDARFLRRYRAALPLLVRQEAERALGDELFLRGAFARDARLEAGFTPDRLKAIPLPPTQWAPRSALHRTRILLAGLAAARHGSYEAIAAVASFPQAELLVRPGEGAEPRGILEFPGVRAANREELARLQGVSLVLAPALCECYPPEVPLAIERGVPVIATRRAAGWCNLDEITGREIAPGDIEQLRQAIDSALMQVSQTGHTIGIQAR